MKKWNVFWMMGLKKWSWLFSWMFLERTDKNTSQERIQNSTFKVKNVQNFFWFGLIPQWSAMCVVQRSSGLQQRACFESKNFNSKNNEDFANFLNLFGEIWDQLENSRILKFVWGNLASTQKFTSFLNLFEEIWGQLKFSRDF